MERKKLALIHIVKRELNLSETEYRRILQQAAGVGSAAELDEPGFQKLMRYFVRSRHYRINDQGMTVRQRWYIQDMLAALGWDEDHTVHFIRKYYHRNSLALLSKKQASNFIESLKHILQHVAGR